MPIEKLPGRALLPGLVNAHSHAFQRVIRARTQWRAGQGDDFWSWRQQMYRAAATVSPDELYAISRLCHLEMLRAGIASAGEFHYLHHGPGGERYRDRNELALRVVTAARDVGLRICLLRAVYARAGSTGEPSPAQQRFLDGSPDEALSAGEALRGFACGRPEITVGLAPHSVRALPRGWLGPLRDYAAAQGMPIHMHVAEQPKEVEACVAEHSLRPVELCAAEGLLGDRFTAVHAIHLSEGEVRQLGVAAANVCACPTTERDLGDGVVPADRLLAAGATLALGTDGEGQIDLLEDARELDYHLRLSTGRRAPLGPAGGGRDSLARRLFAAATEGGARSLGLPVGALQPGVPADFFTVDLTDPSVAGAGEDDLLAAIVFGLTPRAVREVAVGGRILVRDGRHPDEERIVAEGGLAMKTLWARA